MPSVTLLAKGSLEEMFSQCSLDCVQLPSHLKAKAGVTREGPPGGGGRCGCYAHDAECKTGVMSFFFFLNLAQEKPNLEVLTSIHW